MKNILVAPITFAFIALTTFSAFGQKYKTAAGVRFDNGFNLSIQQYIKNGWTAEGILHTPLIGDNLGVSILAEKHRKILFRGTNFYTGLGGHYYWTANGTRADVSTPQNVFGLSGIAGLELCLGRINLAVDWKPELHLTGDQAKDFNWHGASISARYIIEKRERNKVKDWKVWDKLGVKKKKSKR
jgi:hypothetical protein